MKRLVGLTLALAASLSLVLFLGGGPAASGKERGHVIKLAAEGKLRPAKMTVRSHGTTVTKRMPFISDSTMEAAEEALCEARAIPNCDERAEAADATPAAPLGEPNIGTGEGSLGCSRRDKGQGHGDRGAGNVRVNQDCTFRRQAEEEIIYNPANPKNLLAGQNDSRVGYNQCGIDWSLDNGHHWGDMLPPFRQHHNSPEFDGDNSILHEPGDFHTYDAGSDPTLAADDLGNAYFSCVAFDVFFNASMLYVTRSPAGANGSFYYNIPALGPRYIVAEDNSPGVFHDKQFITADYYRSSPNRGNVYVTWTVFKFSPDCGPQPNPGAEERYCSSPIFGSMSTDHGANWSTPEEISGTADALCVFGNFFDPTRNPHACDFDQGSDPIALPNGDLQVIFNNGNTPEVNQQQLGVHCHPTGNSATGTAHLNCLEPVKVGDDVTEGEPQCDFGRGPEECIPGAFIRTNDFPRINTQNAQNSHLYAVWQDYRNGEYDIQLSVSLDGGLTWREVGTLNPDRGLDHYFPAVEQSPKGDDRVGSSYYRTERVPNENAGGPTFTGGGIFSPCNPDGTVPPGSTACAGVQEENSDYVLAGGRDSRVPYDFKVVSAVFPPPDGIQAGFNGDYSGLAINRGEEAHPIWSDTRNVDPFAPTNGVVHDEDIFTDTVGLPNGRERLSTGRIGRR